LIAAPITSAGREYEVRRLRCETAERCAVIRVRSVEVGQRYRAVRSSGSAASTTWEVVAVYRVAPEGIEHARLRQVEDPSETRTLATSVISDRARFVPEGKPRG
jgi:hypothetical protein